MTKRRFKSTFADYMEKYIESRKNLGFQEHSYRRTISLFDEFISIHYPNCDYLSKDVFDSWLETMKNNKRTTRYSKFCVVNSFCRYLNHIGVPCYLPRLPRHGNSDFVPFVFTREQMNGIFTFMDNLRMKQHNGDCHYFPLPTFMRTLYGTGMRFSEAASLKNRNVDLVNRKITLEITKNRQHRMIPINDSLFQVLSQYVEAKSRITRLKHKDADDLFFVSVLGGDMKSATVHHYFRRALDACGIKRCPGRIGPRIHDLRHTFAVHSIMQQVNNGVDLYCALPILSIFLGHKDFRDTETYVRLTAEMYPDIMRKQKELVTDLFPTLFDNEN